MEMNADDDESDDNDEIIGMVVVMLPMMILRKFIKITFRINIESRVHTLFYFHTLSMYIEEMPVSEANMSARASSPAGIR